ncbi:hypothetical protein DPMN_038060, partial [Dreissena polymorpha]
MFVMKTPKPMHSFYLYAGATWNTDMFAESPDGNVDIIEFTTSDMDHTDVLQPIGNISFNGEYVYKTDLSVRNSLNGEVNVCLQATDDMGTKSDEFCLKFVIISPVLDIRPSTASNSDVQIIKPTLSNGSMIHCSERNYVVHECVFDVYVTYLSGINNLKVSNTTSADLAQNVRCTNFRQSSLFHGISSTYVMRCYLNETTIHQKDGHYVCLTVEAGEHADDTVCYEIEFVPAPIRTKREARSPSFELPTPLTGSRFQVVANERNTILLFTTPNNSVCERLQPTSSFIHLLQPVNTTDFDDNFVCLLEMVVQFNKAGSEVIVLKYGNDERIYTFLVTDENVKGYDGQICSNDIVAKTLQENTWPVIDRTSGIVRNIFCIAGKECEVYAFVIYSSRPQVALAYTSKGIDASVEIFERHSMRGIYQVRIGMVPKLAVKHTVCLQTFDNVRIHHISYHQVFKVIPLSNVLLVNSVAYHIQQIQGMEMKLSAYQRLCLQ